MSNKVSEQLSEDQSMLLETWEVVKERENQYAPPLLNHARIAARWTLHLRDLGKLGKNQWITPEDVAWLMILMKEARDVEMPKHDNLVDTAGYADCIDRIDRELKELGYKGGRDEFDGMAFGAFLDLLEWLNEKSRTGPENSSTIQLDWAKIRMGDISSGSIT